MVEAPGGLLRFGIPDFKLEKKFVDRRVAVLVAEGIEFRCNVDVGLDVTAEELQAEFDAVVLAVGSRLHRELDVPGGKLEGVHLAMDYLYDRNRVIAASQSKLVRYEGLITAADKDVVVIGGGDTAADCIANAHRERARSVTQLDRYPPPGGTRPREIAGWPEAPKRLPSTYALDEGGVRRFDAITLGLKGDDEGRVTGVEIATSGGPPDFATLPETEEVLPAQLVLVAIGFARPERDAVRCNSSTPRRTGPATSSPPTTRPRSPVSSPVATHAAASRWWCGPSTKPGRAPPNSASAISLRSARQAAGGTAGGQSAGGALGGRGAGGPDDRGSPRRRDLAAEHGRLCPRRRRGPGCRPAGRVRGPGCWRRPALPV